MFQKGQTREATERGHRSVHFLPHKDATRSPRSLLRGRAGARQGTGHH